MDKDGIDQGSVLKYSPQRTAYYVKAFISEWASLIIVQLKGPS